VNQRILAFANNSLAIEWADELGAELVKFLFAAVPEGPAQKGMEVLQLTKSGQNRIAVRLRNAEGWSWSGEAGEVALFLMERACYFLADGSRGGALFHAACLCQDGKALLLPGGTGSGKTVLSTWLALNGWHLGSDELSFIPASALECQALTRPLHLKGKACALFPELIKKGVFEVEDGWLVPPQALNSAPVGEPPMLAQIIFPHYQAEGGCELQLLSRASTARQLTGMLINARNLPENGFPEVLRLARGIPAYRLVYSQFEQLRSIF
jgi:hypothetical protein